MMHMQAFCSCGERGLLSSSGAWASHCSGFSYCRAQALGMQALVVVAPGLDAPWHVEPSQSRDGTAVSSLGSRFLTTGPSGKSCQRLFLHRILSWSY